MGISYGRWCNLLVWTLLHLVKCKPQECINEYNLPAFGGISMGSYCEETLHNLNCSVGPRNNVEKDTFLLCKIKRRKGWEAYRDTIGNLSYCRECERSQLTSIRVVRIPYENYLDEKNSFPTIQLNFTVPKPELAKHFYTAGGISMTFSSNDDPEFETRYRLLDFSNYSYSSADTDEQRVLSFPCFMGYQHEPCQSDNYKVYTLTLKAFSQKKTSLHETPFTELSYNITIYNYYVYHPTRWKSTIAVAFFPGEKDVTFLFDPVPDSVSVTLYNVSLVNINHNKTYRNKLTVNANHSNCFENVVDGMYYILIEVVTADKKCSDSCRSTKSHIFEIGSPKTMQSAVTGDGGSAAEHMVLPSVGGGVVALLLLGVLCYNRWKNKVQLKDADMYSFPKILLIYSNSRKENVTLATEFAKFCRGKLQIGIIHDRLKDEVTEIEDVGYPSWYTKKLEESSAAIILWTPGSDAKAKEGDNSNEFNVGVTFALNSKTNDDKKVVCVYFDKAQKETISSDIRKEVRVFCIPKKSLELATYLHGHNRLRTHKIDKDSDLEKAILAFNKNNHSNEEIIVPYGQEDIESEETREISEKKLDEEILILKEEYRQNTGNLSNSSKSSASTAENIIYNPDCPVHGEHSNIHRGNTSYHPHPKPERQSRFHRKHPVLFHGEAEDQHSCQNKNNQEYSDQYLDVYNYPVHYSPEEPLITEQNCYPVSKSGHSHHKRIEFSHCHHVQERYHVHDDQGCNSDNILQNIHHNNAPMLLRQYSAEEYSGPSIRSRDKGYRNNQRKRDNITPYDSDSYDEDNENTPLNHPKFYLEEEDIQPSHNVHLKTSNKSCSLDSIESNDSNYSRRSDSISSFDLKMSLQKFI